MPSNKVTFKRVEAVIGLDDASNLLFATGGERLKSDAGSGSDFGFLQGGTILKALSIELMLKMILEDSSGTFERTHVVEDLVNALDASLRTKLEDAYTTRTQSESWPDFNTLLGQISGVFVEWRYATMDAKSLNLQPQPWDYLAKLIRDELPAA